MLAVPYGATPQVGRDYAAELKGKVVLDTGNPYPSRDGDMAVRDRAARHGVASAEYLPGTRLVRAFNAINSGRSANEAFRKPEKIGIPLAADDAEAMKIAAQLVADAGFDPVPVGKLSRAPRSSTTARRCMCRATRPPESAKNSGLKSTNNSPRAISAPDQMHM